MSCEICNLKKEKRFCPAVHGRICPQCCGESREVTLDCPAECPYLQQARANEKERTPEQFAGEELFRNVEVGQRFYYEREPLLAGVLFTLARLGASHRDWNDRDMIGALTGLARSYERLAGSGIIYNESTTNPIHQTVSAELEKMLADYRNVEEKNLGFFTLKNSDILKALVFAVRTAHTRTSGRPRSRAFLAYLATQFAGARESSSTTASSGLIVP